MRILTSRLLRGPNRYESGPCCEVAFDGDEPIAARVVGRLAVRAMRRVDRLARVASVVASRGVTRLAVAYEPGSEAIAEAALALANEVVDMPRGERMPAVDRSITRLRELAALAAPSRTDVPRRIPIVAITGTNGKTTTTALIAHVVAASGARTGVTTTAGIAIDGRVVEQGDCAGPLSARRVLQAPDVDVAVFETARGGLLRRGLAFDRCEVGVVLNIAPDHLGIDGVETLEDLAHVKGIVARAASRMAVLNAEDPLCVAMRDTLRPGCETVWFSLDPRHPVIVRHLADGGRAAALDDGRLTWCEGDARRPVIDAAALPFTLQGHARYNVANALAALAALVGLGHATDTVAAAMTRFASDALQNPLRGNRFDVAGVTLVVDYAHNGVAYRALCETARALLDDPSRRLVGVITSPGDRRTEDLREVGTICGASFDELFVYEHHPRGRAPGETIDAILDGARAIAPGKPLHAVPSIRTALADGIGACRRGDVLVFTCAGTLADVLAGVRRARPEAAPAIAAAMGLAA